MRVIGEYTLVELNGERIAVPIGQEDGFHGIVRLNETGAYIWNGLTAGLSPEQIAEKLVADYESVDLPRARQAVQGVVDRLVHEGLVEE